jgi:hypothetical protein
LYYGTYNVSIVSESCGPRSWAQAVVSALSKDGYVVLDDVLDADTVAKVSGLIHFQSPAPIIVYLFQACVL